MRDDENIGSISKFYFGASAERLSYTQFTASRTRFCPQARNLTHSSSTVPPLDYPPRRRPSADFFTNIGGESVNERDFLCIILSVVRFFTR